MRAPHRTLRSAALAVVFGLVLGSGVHGIPEALDLTPVALAQAGDGDDGGVPDGGPPDDGGGVSEEQAATIDFSRTGSITIHKRVGDTGVPADGNEVADPPGTPLENTAFQFFLVKEYKNGQDVIEGQQMTVEEAEEAIANDNYGAMFTTDSDGVLTLPDIPLGRYLVAELHRPGYEPVEPFLISVPMTNPATRAGWNYDVHVYPKNKEFFVNKAVVDAGKHVGDKLTYTITSDIRTPPKGGLSSYAVNDYFNPEKLDIDPDDISVGLSDGTKFIRDKDYRVTKSSGVVSVSFTSAGLATLTEKHTEQVITTLPATVKEYDGWVDPNMPAGSGGVPVVNWALADSQWTNAVTTFFGKLRVEKADEAGAALPGATFEVRNCTSKDKLGEKITVNGEDTWTTGADGSLTINGLHVTDYVDDKDADEIGKYCLVEVEAPEGYELLTEPVEVDFTREAIGAVDESNAADDRATLVKEIANVKSTAPSLPMTGGMGIGIIAALGALIIGAGAWLAKRNGSKA